MAAQALFLWVGIVLSRRETDRLYLAGALALAAVLTAGYGLLQYGGLDMFPRTAFQEAWGRVTSTFENSNHFGNFLACTLPLGVALFFMIRRGAWCALGGVALIYAGILLCSSRGAWVAAIGGVACAAAGGVRASERCGRPGGWARAAALGAAMLVVTLGLSDQPVSQDAGRPVRVRERLMTTREVLSPATPETQSFAHRKWIWRMTLAMIREHPLLGCGPGRFETAFAERRNRAEGAAAPFESVAYAHNEWLHIAAESGLIGVLGFAGLVGVILLRSLKRLGTDPVLWGFYGSAVAMLLHSLISYPIRLPFNGMIFWLALGVLAGTFGYRDLRRESACQ